MADNVVETILIKLGLDTGGFGKDANEAVKKTNEIAKSSGVADSTVLKLGKTIGKVFGVAASLTGLKALIDEVQKLNDELYFLEKNLGMSSTTIKAWQGAAAAMGGSSQGMTDSIKSLNMAMNDFKTMGDTSMLPFMNALGVSMVDANNKLRDTDKVMLDLADSFSKMDREQAFSLASKMGIDEGAFNTLAQGRAEMEKMIEYQKTMYKSSERELEVSRQLAKNRALLGSHWESMKMMLANALMPVLVKVSEVLLGMFDYLQKNQRTVQAVIKGIAFAVGVVLIPVLTKAALAATAMLLPFAPLIATVTALGAAFGLLYDDYKIWAEGGNSLFNWGAFKSYIDNSTLSTDNLAKAFKNLGKELIGSAIPTLRGYAEIVTKLLSGDFRGAGSQAWDMIKNFGGRVGDVVDDITGQSQGTAAAAAASVVAPPPAASGGKSGWSLGQTSHKFETGNRGAGTISSGAGDKGGASYGSYQMSSKLGVVQDFLKTSGYGSKFAGMTVNSKEFNDTWKSLAKNDPNFAKAQHDYIEKTHYNVQMAGLKRKGINLNTGNQAIQDMIWSTAVQFGPHNSVIAKALSGSDSSKMTDEQIIKAVQDYKFNNTKSLFKSSPTLWDSLSDRASKEKAALLALNTSNGANTAIKSMNQGAGLPATIARLPSGGNKVDVKVDNLNVNTTASSVTGIMSDAGRALGNNLFQWLPSSH